MGQNHQFQRRRALPVATLQAKLDATVAQMIALAVAESENATALAAAKAEAIMAREEATATKKETEQARQDLVRVSTTRQSRACMASPSSPAQVLINTMNQETIQNLSALVTRLRRDLEQAGACR